MKNIIKTIKDLVKEQATRDNIKDEAIKFFLHRLKYKGNPYKIFLDFHNITEDDLKW